MKKLIYLFIMVITISGCATSSIGSRGWYNKRIAEIEEAYQKGEITKAEYIQLKNEADNVRAPYDSRWSVSVGNKKR